MAYSYETSSVRTINGEVSGLADVVARQAIANLPTLSGGEGIQIVNEDGKNRIDLGLSAGSNMSFVYDQESNTIRLDAEGGNYSGIDPIVVNNTTKQISADTWTFSAGNGLTFADDNDNKITRIDVNENFTNYYKKTETSSKQEISAALNDVSSNFSNYYTKTDTSSKQEISAAINNINNDIQYVSANAGHAYIGVEPIYVNNETNLIGITGESLSAGPNIDIFASGGYVVISANGGGSTFPITGTDGTTGFTANMDCSSVLLTTGASPAGGYVRQTVRGVQYEAYPATDVSASWYNIINAANDINLTCSAVKLSTAANSTTFYTSALPNLNKITFISPSYGPYETYSALIDDGDTEFKVEVDSGCCVTVVRAWSDDRNKDVWYGLNQETYFYIG